MSRSPANHEQLIEQRRQITDGGDPINREDMSVHYDGNSLVIGLTHIGTTIHNIDDDDYLTVETYDNGFWIPIPGSDDGGDE